MILLLTCIISWNLKCNSVIVSWDICQTSAETNGVLTNLCTPSNLLFQRLLMPLSTSSGPFDLHCSIYYLLLFFKSLLALDCHYFDHSQSWVFLCDRLLSLANSVNFRVNPWLAWFLLQASAYASNTNCRKTVLFAVNKRTNLGSNLAENSRILLALSVLR